MAPRNTLVELELDLKHPAELHGVFRVPAELPLFRDHFPGQPILPAFVIVDFVFEQLCRRWPDLKSSALRLPKLKLLEPMVPGDTFALRARRSGDRITFSLVIDTEATVSGVFKLAGERS